MTAAVSRWPKSIVYWRGIGRDNGTLNVSVPFTWMLPEAVAFCRAHSYTSRVRIGGPAVSLMPGYVTGCGAQVGGDLPALAHHNLDATFTTRGCPRRCMPCAVHRIEPEFSELADWTPAPIVCDNNLLAASKKHFNRVIDREKVFDRVDFNQGLDARLLKPSHLSRLAELHLVHIRYSWDWVGMESQVMDAITATLAAGIPRKRISIYVLIGIEDTPEDALYRLESVRTLGIKPFPMRYQPLDALVKDSHVAPGWTAKELRRMMRYWSRQNWLSKVPYAEYA